MAKAGRKNAYETNVKPFFPQIQEWVENGATERQIAANLGVGYSTFNKYKIEHKELMELLKNRRRELVKDLRGSLVKRAMGFDYTETKTVTEKMTLPDEIKSILLDNGFTLDDLDKAKLVRTEIMTKHALPDVAALNLALKNYDKENWSNDPQMLDIRKKELELKEKQVENNIW